MVDLAWNQLLIHERHIHSNDDPSIHLLLLLYIIKLDAHGISSLLQSSSNRPSLLDKIGEILNQLSVSLVPFVSECAFHAFKCEINLITW